MFRRPPTSTRPATPFPSTSLFRSPVGSPLLMALFGVLVAFFSASQDIVVDAYRIESLEESEQGAGAAAYVLGYRVGILAAGAGALLLADAAGWFLAYLAMAGLMLVGLATVLASPEPAGPAPARPGSATATTSDTRSEEHTS